MKREQMFSIMEKWSERDIDEGKFNEVLQIDGTPVWYLLESLIKQEYLPRPFKSLAEIEKSIKSDKAPTGFENSKINLIYFGLRKGLLLNERIKRFVSPSKEKKTDEKDVLFLGYTNEVSLKNREPRPVGFADVVDDLKRKGIKSLVLFCDPLSQNSFGKLRKFQNLLYSYIDPEIIKESKRLSRELNQKWKKIGEEKKAELFTFGGESYWKFLRSGLNFLFSREMLDTLVMHYLTFKKIIESHKIKVVYLTSLGGFYEALLLAAVCRLNKKVIYSAHGYGGRYFVVSSKLIENVFFAAWGNEEKEKLLKLGIPKEKVFLTGSPFFDEITKYRKRKKVKKTITLITQPLVEDKDINEKEYFDFIHKLLVQINKVKNVAKIIVKLHPRERYKSLYESIAKSLGLRNIEVTQEPGKDALYSILRDSDLLISYGSTTDIEGIMLDKNVIDIDGLKKGPVAEAAKKDKYREAVVMVNKNGDLTGAIARVLTNRDLQIELRQKRKRYLIDSFYKMDGRAHERVADLIKSLM